MRRAILFAPSTGPSGPLGDSQRRHATQDTVSNPSEPVRAARLVVGLGNPGAEYAETRHNVGFRVLDHLAEHLGLLFRGPSALENWTGPKGFEWARTELLPTEDSETKGDNLSGGAVFGWLLKPGTYMNRSGEIVAPVARWLSRNGVLPALDPEPSDEATASDGEDGSGSPFSGTPLSGSPFADSIEPDPASILVVFDDMDLEPGVLRLRPHGGHGGQNGMRNIMDRLRTDRFPRLRVGIGRAGTDAARHVLSPFSPKEEECIGVSIAEASEAAEAFLRGEDFSALMTRFHSRWKGSG